MDFRQNLSTLFLRISLVINFAVVVAKVAT
jgi:hypothetical protein